METAPVITIKTLPNFTEQEVFNYAVTKFFEQGERSVVRSVDETGIRCNYRSEKDGKQLRCMAGFFIADDEYTPMIEGEGFGINVLSRITPIDKRSSHHELEKQYKLHLIRDLQMVHDASLDSTGRADLSEEEIIAEMPKRLEAVALRNKLEIPPILAEKLVLESKSSVIEHPESAS